MSLFCSVTCSAVLQRVWEDSLVVGVVLLCLDAGVSCYVDGGGVTGKPTSALHGLSLKLNTL